MSFYRTRPGQSPAMIARELGTSVASLMAANPHKPTAVVAGKRTFGGIHINELLHVPRAGVGALGDGGTLGAITPSAPGAPHAMIRQGSSGPDVALWQTIIGVTADGIFGPKTAAATRAWQGTHGVAADGIVGPKTWAAALSSAAAPTPAPAPVMVPSPSVTPVAPSSNLALSAGAAVFALTADPNYCTSVAKAGTAVNTAVHNFKAAWNASNPSNKVPIGTGKYEPVVAAALSSALGGTTVPPGCGGAAVPAPAPTPMPLPVPVPIHVPQPAPVPSPGAPPPPPTVTPVPTPPPIPPPPVSAPLPPSSTVPPAVQALLSIDPCDLENAALICQAQSALGVTADGKYGPNTAAAARRLIASAPGGCTPRPAWWTPSGASNCPGAAPPPSSGGGGGGGGGALPAPTPSPPASGGLTPSGEKKGLSTGAIVAGAVGAAALVGLIALAAGGSKTTSRTTIRGPARRSSKRKPARRSAKRKKSKR